MKPQTPQKIEKLGDIAFNIFLIGVVAALLLELQGLKMSSFDFLAGSAVPRVLCWSLIALCCLSIVRSALLLTGRGYQQAIRDDPADIHVDKHSVGKNVIAFQLVSVIAISTLYIMSIVFGLIPYSVSTAVVLASTMVILCPREKRNYLLIGAMACVIGGGAEYLFTTLLPLPLPSF